MFEEYGDPSRVLKLQDTDSKNDGPIHVKMLAATVNPADINMIQGNYGTSIQLPAIAGNEGVGVIESDVHSNFKKGDWVIPVKPGFGTWRTEFKCNADDIIKIPNNIPVEYAAGISSNPCTAFCLLSDFVSLEKGDTVIQNAANSTVGQCVTQIAKTQGINVINVIRSRETKELNALKDKMKSYGAENIITEEELVDPSFNEKFKNISKPILAINSVGGSSATNIAKRLDQHGYMVTIGGMSRKPILVPTGAMIFKDLTFAGFWMTRWINENTISDRKEILSAISDLIVNGDLKISYESVPLDSYKETIKRSMEPKKDTKFVFKLN